MIRGRVAVLGLGVSGRAAVQALQTHTQAEVSVWDSNLDAVTAFDLPGGTDIGELIAWQPDVVIISPGIPASAADYQALEEAGITLWSEIELAWRLRDPKVPWLCVTGTNGKTTTVEMVAHILNQAGSGAAIGNIGMPAVAAVTAAQQPDAYAVELSSFQLQNTHTMAPAAAVCLNLAPDHLQWHGSMAAYSAAKARIYDNAQVVVLPVGDEAVAKLAAGATGKKVGLRVGMPNFGEIGFVEDLVVDRAFGQDPTTAAALFELNDIMHLAPAAPLPVHLVKDALAAAALTRAIGVDPQHIASALATFTTAAHRNQVLGEYCGVRYVDDSKATNPHAAQASVLALDNVVWIVGGQSKGVDFTELVARVADRLKAVVVLGVDQQPWRKALAGIDVPVSYIDPADPDPMTAAVDAARGYASAGDTVILAPASASLDQFESYAERGEHFARAIEVQNA